MSYFTQGKPAKGDYQFASTFEGVNYWFANAANKETFDRNPARYLPQSGVTAPSA